MTKQTAVIITITPELKAEIDGIIKKNPELWANRSHFFRAAAIRVLRSFNK
jgi:metal-responsive CopG/Arc/MetJ family transcriptional regulator